MAKSVSKFGTRETRKKLKSSGKPHLEGFEKGLDFGYRKGQRGGSWVIRRYLGDRKYAVETIGAADDDAEADGVKILTYHQARDRARARTQAIAEEARVASLGPVVTVRTAVEDYLTLREKREAKDHVGKGVKRDARSRLTKHVLAVATLSEKSLASLTRNDLSRWRADLQLADGSIGERATISRRRSTSQRGAMRSSCRQESGTSSRTALRRPTRPLPLPERPRC